MKGGSSCVPKKLNMPKGKTGKPIKSKKSLGKHIKHTGGGKKTKKKTKKRKLNAFFLKMKEAKANNKSEFVYNNKTYKRKEKGPLIYYK